MAIRDWFGKKPPDDGSPAAPSVPSTGLASTSEADGPDAPEDDRVEVGLPPLLAAVAAVVPHHIERPPLLELVRARLADGLRDQQLEPPLPEEFAQRWQSLDDDGRSRLAVLVDAVRAEPIAFFRPGTGQGVIDGQHALDAYARCAADSSSLTLPILQQSAVRIEELVRRLLSLLDVGVVGERAAQSLARLHHIDYGRLLKEAAAAKVAAEARLAELQKRKDQQEANLRSRGKR